MFHASGVRRRIVPGWSRRVTKMLLSGCCERFQRRVGGRERTPDPRRGEARPRDSRAALAGSDRLPFPCASGLTGREVHLDDPLVEVDRQPRTLRRGMATGNVERYAEAEIDLPLAAEDRAEVALE